MVWQKNAPFWRNICTGQARESKKSIQPDFPFKNMLYPDIVRATALSLLSGYPVKESFAAIESGLSDPDALVRQTAISTINLLQFDKDAKLYFSFTL